MKLTFEIQMDWVKGFYFGSHSAPGVRDVMVERHNINRGINLPALRPLFTFHKAKFLSIVLPAYVDSGHKDFAVYVASARNDRAAMEADGHGGFDMLIFRRCRSNGNISSIEDADLKDDTLIGVISQ